MPPADAPPPGLPLRVRVPASTSNLGPGFDQLGLALELWLEVELGPRLDAPGHRLGALAGTAGGWPREENRLLLAFDAAAQRYGLPAAAYEFRASSEIPLQRGLGSSGAAVAAGLALAARLAGAGADDLNALAALGTRIEGHPDNVTASLLGGCTLGVPLEDGELRVVRQPLCDALRFVAVWPATPLRTEEARAALPSALAFEDVVWTTRRLTLLREGLATGDPALLRAGADDRLHTPYRLPLIPGAREALAAAYAEGAWLAAISGSGSALLAIHGDEARCAAIAEAMQDALRRHHDWAEGRVVRASRRGAHAPD